MAKRTITLGVWEDKPIRWIVLKKESFGSLVLSENHLFSMSLLWKGSWLSSNFRTYLNNDFFSKAFNDKEKRKIVCSLIKPELTKDNVFLLSTDEVIDFMTLDERLLKNNWYLRTAHGSTFMKSVNGSTGELDFNNGNYYIRPAMYVRES